MYTLIPISERNGKGNIQKRIQREKNSRKNILENAFKFEENDPIKRQYAFYTKRIIRREKDLKEESKSTDKRYLRGVGVRERDIVILLQVCWYYRFKLLLFHLEG